MSNSLLHAAYHPLLVLLFGTLVFFAFVGIGQVVSHLARLRLSSPWRMVCALLLGIQCVALIVELAAMTGMATHPFLLGLAAALLVVGCMSVAQLLSQLWMRSLSLSAPAAAFALVGGIALSSTLLTAMAPSSKMDEIYYHMLVPARIVADGGLTFYREPWEAAIWTQMAFQIALTPLHALGMPDAGNVTGWWLGATLAYFAWRLIAKARAEAWWSVAWAAALCIGLYPAVWHVTSGSQAMGDLALAAGVVAYLRRHDLLSQVGPLRFGALASVLALAAASSSIFLLPISILVLALTLAWLVRPDWRKGGALALVVIVPWIVFFAPIDYWATASAGSPLTRFLANLGPGFSVGTMIDSVIGLPKTNASTLSEFVLDVFGGYSPLIWLGVVGALVYDKIPLEDRVTAFALLVIQVGLMVFLLHPASRFLGGLQYGLAIAFAVACATVIEARFAQHGAVTRYAMVLALLVPWLALQMYYAAQFFPVAFGVQTKEAFYERYIAFYRDFVALDRILPPDAVLLCTDFSFGSVYAPRPIFSNAADVPAGRPLFALITTGEPTGTPLTSLGEFSTGEVIYRNPQAVVAAFRTPGRLQVRGGIEVVRLKPR